MPETCRPVWRMNKAQLATEIERRLEAKGHRPVYAASGPPYPRTRWSKTELENEAAALRAEVGIAADGKPIG
jgi:hypothetical protein